MIKHLTEREAISLAPDMNQVYNAVYQANSPMGASDHFERMLVQVYQLDLNPVTLLAQEEEALAGVLFGYDFVENSWWARQIQEYLPDGVDWHQGSFELNELMVHPDYQGRGLARSLLNQLISHANYEHVLLCVRENNTPAIHSYESLNFKTFARQVSLEHYDSVHFNLMSLDLTQRTQV